MSTIWGAYHLWAFPGFEGCAGQGGSYQVTTKNKVFLEYIFHYFLIFSTNFIAGTTAQKDRLYREMRKLKEEVAEAENVKRSVEQVIPPTEQRKEKSKTQDISL